MHHARTIEESFKSVVRESNDSLINSPFYPSLFDEILSKSVVTNTKFIRKEKLG